MPRARTAPRPATVDPVAIRAILRRAVEADGRPQRELAESVGTAQPNLSRLLAGDRANPGILTVGRLLAALGLPWAALDSDD